MATYDAEFTDDVFFGENNVFHETHVYAGETIYYLDEFRVLDIPSHNDDSLTYDENFNAAVDLLRQRSESLTFSESWVARSGVTAKTLTQSIHYSELWFADADAFPRSYISSVHYSESLSATKVIAPDRRLLLDSLTYGETLTALKVKTRSDAIRYLESWCLGLNVLRSWHDTLSLREVYFRRVGNNPYDPRNGGNPISDGSGFTMIGNVRRKRYDILQYSERWTPVDALGMPLQFMQCHVTTLNSTSIVSVQIVAPDQATVTFDRPVTVISNTPDSAFQINGFPATLSSQLTSNTVELDASSAVWSTGDPWQLTAQPNWIQEALQTGSGTCI